jgi:hypothetical protein
MPHEQAQNQIETLKSENKKLKLALLLAIPWIGEPAEGPEWATPEAKEKNRAMSDCAFKAATSFFPNGSDEFEEEMVKFASQFRT